jgi:hypothetical protein
VAPKGLLQHGAAAVEARAHHADGQIQDLRDLRVGAAFDLGQDDDGPIGIRQRVQRPSDILPQKLVDHLPLGIAPPEQERLVDLLEEREMLLPRKIHPPGLFRPGVPAVADEPVHQDAVDPFRKGLPILEPPEVRPCARDGFRDEIPGVGRIARQTQRRSIEPVHEALQPVAEVRTVAVIEAHSAFPGARRIRTHAPIPPHSARSDGEPT